MKKLLSMLLVLACTLSMAACGGKDSEDVVTAKVVDIDLTSEQYAFGVDKTQPELLDAVNAFIQEIKTDGTLDEICDKYFGDGEKTPVVSAELDAVAQSTLYSSKTS